MALHSSHIWPGLLQGSDTEGLRCQLLHREEEDERLAGILKVRGWTLLPVPSIQTLGAVRARGCYTNYSQIK